MSRRLSNCNPSAALVIAASLLLAPAAALAQPVSPEEVNASIKDGNYKQALQKIAGALSLRGEAGKKVDQYQMYMLKAECHVRMKVPTMAAQAYTNAAKAATDDKSRNIAAAHELLMRKQRGLAYKPLTSQQGKPASPNAAIDITDPANRRKAFAALFTDELAALQPRIAAARRATGLAPIFEAFKLIPRLEGIELAAGEPPATDAPQTHKLLGELAEQSRKLIDTALRDMGKQVVAIDREANQYVEITRQVPDPTAHSPYGVRYKIERAYKKKGLADPQMKQLENLSATCDQVAHASQQIAEGVPAQAKGFETLITETERIKKEAQRILDADYITVYKDLPTKPRP